MEVQTRLAAGSEPARKSLFLRASRVSVRSFSILYGGISVFTLYRACSESKVGVLEGSTVLTWEIVLASFAIVGCIAGLLLSFETFKTRTVFRIAVASFSIVSMVGAVLFFIICFRHFSMFWIVFTGLHIFLSLMCASSAYGVAGPQLKVALPLDETAPLAAS